ncbi:MAG: hypothetical protein K2X47_03755 [Bdellovibrionales bacterium]|nr:hypothetical protein [Bdellovibrionales bacterium]
MKTQFKFILLSFVFASSAVSFSEANSVKVKMADVVTKVSEENLLVYQNALKVYQVKKGITVSRANLLPKLNFWRILSTPFTAGGLLGVVNDVAPFLIPSNWFQLKAQKELYKAQVEAYRALWANEVMTAKALYFHLVYDKSLLDQIEKSKAELKSLSSMIRSREVLGGAPIGASREVEVRLLALEEDTRALKVLVEEEMSILAFMMGFGSTGNIEIENLPVPEISKLGPLKYDDFEFRVLDSAPEVKQYEHVVEASKSVKKTAQFSLFGVTNDARGVAGGIFDNVPIQDGLGFGTPASIQIAKSQTEMLRSQKLGVIEVLKRQLRVLVTTYNLDLENYPGLTKRVELTKAINQQLYDRLRLGQDVDTFSLIEASRNRVQAETALFSANFRFMINEDKISRLMFHGDYAKKPTSIDVLRQQGGGQ